MIYFRKFLQILSLIYRKIVDNFSFKKTFNFSNLLKILFIYSCSILWVIILDFNFSTNFFNKLLSGSFSDESSNRRVAIYSVQERIGEDMLYQRMIKVADEMGIDFVGISFQEFLMNQWPTRHLYKAAANIVNYIFNPKFNLALTHHVNILPIGYNVMYLNIPAASLYNVKTEFVEHWKHLSRYDAYVDLYSYFHSNNKFLDQAIKKEGHEKKKVVTAYIAQNYVDYSPVDMNEAVVTGTFWGCNRNSLRISTAMKRLADEGLLVGYGNKNYQDFLGKAYLGRFESYGDIVKNMIAIPKKHGIALIIHNLEHMLEGLPTSRISEAAAGGLLIISDHNKFIEKYFGDNVLYFDQFADDVTIYNQIKAHILWARKNPDKARAKAQACHDIFAQNFTMEKQFLKVIEALE